MTLGVKITFWWPIRQDVQLLYTFIDRLLQRIRLPIKFKKWQVTEKVT